MHGATLTIYGNEVTTRVIKELQVRYRGHKSMYTSLLLCYIVQCANTRKKDCLNFLILIIKLIQ